MNSGSNVGSGEAPQTSNFGQTGGPQAWQKLLKNGLAGAAGGLQQMQQPQQQMQQQNPFLQQMTQRNPFYGGQ